MRKLSKVFAVVMALCMALLCVACGDKSNNPGQTNEDNGKTYNLVFTTHLPETGVDGASLKYFLEQVTKETKGRVTFETYFGGSMTKSGETLEAVAAAWPILLLFLRASMRASSIRCSLPCCLIPPLPSGWPTRR